MIACTKFLLFSVALLGWSMPALAQREQLFVGARPMALGETFVAIADDGNASYWNPAGLAFIRRQELNSLYNDLYGLGIRNGFLSLLYPLSLRHAIGANWFYVGFNDTEDHELDFQQNTFTFSYSYAISKHLALGANLKYLRLSATLDEKDPVANGSGFGADLGALFTHTFKKRLYPKKIQLGVMAHDFTNTKVQYRGSDARDTILRRNIRFGAAVQPFDKLSSRWLTLSEPLVAMDLDDRWHIGAELWLNRTLALRAGIQNDIEKREGAILSFGTGMRWQFLQFDYAYTVPPTLGETHRFSVSLRSEENPRWVTIAEASMQEIFASLYLAYQNPANAWIGTAFMTNTSEDTLPAIVSLRLKDYKAKATQWEVKLAPRQSTPVRLRAAFPDEILNITGRGKLLKAELAVSYPYKDRRPEDHKNVEFFVHGTGAITWEDPGRAAAFVNQLDPCVQTFAEKVLANYPLPENIWIAKESSAACNAMLLFAALRELHLHYLKDPNRDLHTIDTIHYPRSLLSGGRHAGDCDDLTVLYASLLESCGIETAFLSTRNHFFMMFNTGLHRNRPVPYDENLFVAQGNTLWMPIETTVCATGGDFGEAWERGAENYRQYRSENDLKVLLVTEQQRIYPAPDFKSEAPCVPPKSPASVEFGLEKKTQQLLDSLYALAQRMPDSLAVRNRIGIVWALVGDEPKAEKEFLYALNRNSSYVPAINNLANVKFILSEFVTADSLYRRALTLDPYQPGAYLNQAMLAQFRKWEWLDNKRGEKAQQFQNLSDTLLAEAARRLAADTTRAFELLGFSQRLENGKAGLTAEIKERIKRVKTFVDRGFRQSLKQKFVRNAVLEKTGTTKGHGQEDEGRSATLWWSK